jgi:SpoVK/Ycf46/Vps4 family AAA+-type ATPase
MEITHNDDSLELMKSKNLFIVNQTTPFLVEPNIYCKVFTTKSSNDDKTKVEIENIKIEIYSYCYSHDYLTNFLDNINIEYKKNINEARNNKKFIYTLNGSKLIDNNNDYNRSINRNMNVIWNECEFKSSRTFNNLFFENKKLLLNKLNFFINNKDWYDYEGHPWTFGIGLHGPPGTGKTSIIKSIANKLNRHIIIIPLSKIKTQTQFNEYFFEEYYSNKNYKKIDFTEKIIVFEDIDCMTEIVKKRKILSDSDSEDGTIDIVKDFKDNEIDKKLHIQNKLLNKIAKKVDDEHNDSYIFNVTKDKDDVITLSYILNIIDGIRETPGRILIITSNNYDSLDPALIRPGRIDLTLEMKNASIDIIKEMYSHYYQDILPEDIELKLRDNLISPAKIVNLRLQNSNKEDFIKALINEF